MKTYEVYYRGELIAEVIDFEKGFDAVLFDLSDTEIVEVEGTRDSGIYVKMEPDAFSQVLAVMLQG
jgi:hypothetical protein